MLPRTCLAASPLPLLSDLARHLLLRIILSEHDAASYGLRKFFPVGTRMEAASPSAFAYVGIKLLAGRLRDISVAVAGLAALFVIKFALL